MCGGFTCSKNALIALNILYVVSRKQKPTTRTTRKLRCVHREKKFENLHLLNAGTVNLWLFMIAFVSIWHDIFQMIGFLLIGVGVYARAASVVTNLPIVGGILACGVILICISMLGLAGAVKHHQVMLFFVSFLQRQQQRKCPTHRPTYHIYLCMCRKSARTSELCLCNVLLQPQS